VHNKLYKHDIFLPNRLGHFLSDSAHESFHMLQKKKKVSLLELCI
jgi:hypothetical protein